MCEYVLYTVSMSDTVNDSLNGYENWNVKCSKKVRISNCTLLCDFDVLISFPKRFIYCSLAGNHQHIRKVYIVVRTDTVAALMPNV